MASSIFFRCQNQNFGIFMLKITGAPLCFDKITKRKKVASSIFWNIKNLPASSVFHKSGHIYFFINNGLDERPNHAYNWPGATLFWITTMYLN